MAVTFLEALVPLALTERLPPVGWLTVYQVYVRLDSPAGSAPRTLRLVDVVVTVEGVAAAGVATLGPLSDRTRAGLPLEASLAVEVDR